LAFLGGFHRGSFAAGAGADDDDIVVLVVHAVALTRVGAKGGGKTSAG